MNHCQRLPIKLKSSYNFLIIVNDNFSEVVHDTELRRKGAEAVFDATMVNCSSKLHARMIIFSNVDGQYVRFTTSLAQFALRKLRGTKAARREAVVALARTLTAKFDDPPDVVNWGMVVGNVFDEMYRLAPL